MTTKWFVLGISGVTCGGKSTLANALYDFFNDSKNSYHFANHQVAQVQLINQDRYFYPRDSPKHVWIKEINFINRERLAAIDMDSMWSDIQSALASHSNEKTIDNVQCTAITNGNNLSELNRLNILIVEGFLIFSDNRINDLCDLKIFLELPYNVCLERRLKRVFKHVNPQPVKYFQEFIWPTYEKYLSEIQRPEEIKFLSGESTPEQVFETAVESIAKLVL